MEIEEVPNITQEGAHEIHEDNEEIQQEHEIQQEIIEPMHSLHLIYTQHSHLHLFAGSLHLSSSLWSMKYVKDSVTMVCVLSSRYISGVCASPTPLFHISHYYHFSFSSFPIGDYKITRTSLAAVRTKTSSARPVLVITVVSNA